jgi:hypothetical protein
LRIVADDQHCIICERNKEEDAPAVEEIKPTFTHGKLYSYRWQKRRRLHLMQEPLCRRCSQEGRVTAAEVVDHIEPHRYDINKFILGKLQSLCASCHSKIKQQEEVNARIS